MRNFNNILNPLPTLMPNSPLPSEELQRLEELYRYGILDTETESEFDELAMLAAKLSGCPIAAISFIDSNRQWFKANYGDDTKETPRDVSFCAHTILSDDALV